MNFNTILSLNLFNVQQNCSSCRKLTGNDFWVSFLIFLFLLAIHQIYKKFLKK